MTNSVIQAKEDGKSATEQADSLYKLARKEVRSGNVERGKTLLQQVLALDPQHRQAQADMNKFLASGTSISPDTTVIAAAKATASSTEIPASLDSLSSTEMVDVAKAMMRDGDYPAAANTLERALKKSKDDTERRQIRAYLNAIAQQQGQVEETRTMQLEYNLSELDTQLQKALIYMDNGQFDKAEVELRRAQEIAPADPRVAELLKRLGKEAGSDLATQAGSLQKSAGQEAAGQAAMAENIFREGVDFYKQGRVIEAVQKWEAVLKIAPEHQASKTYLTNTRMEYTQAVRAKEEAAKKAAEDAKFEKLLDTEIFQYSTRGERVDIKNVVSFLSNLSGLNVVMAENLEGLVAFEVKNTTVRGVLNLLQKQYGYVWERDKNTIFVKRGFNSRVFPLTPAQFETIETILDDPSVLQDSSKNLKTILYGPDNEFDVPGKELFLNTNTNSLVVTDTDENLQKVEAFLKAMPVISVDMKKPVVIGVYKLDRDISKEIYEMVKIVLFEGQGGYDVNDNRRQLFLEPTSNNLIVIDYPDNIKKVEDLLSNQQITSKLEEGDLVAKQFTITDMDDIEDTPESLARREEFVGGVAEIIQQMLYGKTGVDAAKLQGRLTVANPARGTIDIVDTRSNIRRVEEYLSSIRGETTQDILIESYPIKHVSVFDIADAMAYLFFDSQQSTRNYFLSQNSFQSLGTSEQGDVGDFSNLVEETTRNRFNLSGGGGGGTDLLQYFTVRFFPDINTNTLVVFTTDQEVLDLIDRIISTYDKPQRQLELENRIVTVSLDDLRTINFDYFLSNPFQSKINLTNPDKQLMDVAMINNNDTGLTLSMNTLGSTRMQFLMNLLESTTSMNVLSAPKMLYMPNAFVTPQLFVGQQIPYVQDVQYDDGGDNDPTNNRLTYDFQRAFTGISLAFVPFILNDDHVVIEMIPQVIEPGERLPISLEGGAPSDIQVPNIGPLILGQTFAQTAVRMKSGETVVLGGLITENESESQNRIPLVNKIPFIGTLFKDRAIEKSKLSMLIFLTCRIIEPEY
ncbi:MAG: tetratricopeptide repeat protein [bacterium]|nr:tetratricopeptide repeat protein [bacterium]